MLNKQMNIILCVNSKYVIPSVVCITSILENNKNPIHFYILHSDLTKDEIFLMQNAVKRKGREEQTLSAMQIPPDTFSDLPIYGRSKEAYFRLLIPDILPKGLDRCLYLDGDTIVLKSLEQFYSTPFDGQALVVSEDLGEQVFFHKERHSVLNIPLTYGYFNSGVLLWNLEWFRKNFSMQSVYGWIKANHPPASSRNTSESFGCANAVAAACSAAIRPRSVLTPAFSSLCRPSS
jgi:lipopolysaccharide biosynthesis glycosyltransferase